MHPLGGRIKREGKEKEFRMTLHQVVKFYEQILEEK